MFQPLEVTEAQTVWIDSPSDDRLGFQDSSRVRIDRDPMGTGDFSEPGEGFKATLLGGMWPDDDELRLLVVGVVPGSEMAYEYLTTLGTTPIEKPDVLSYEDIGWERLRNLVQIMPSWSDQMERAIFVLPGLPRIKPETVKTAAVNSEPDRKLPFDMFRIQVDAMLIAKKHEPSDMWMGDDGEANMSVMRHQHKRGATPKEYVDNFTTGITMLEEINGRDQDDSQDAPA